MGFLDFLKGIGGGIMSGIQKAAGLVGKIAPMVSQVAGMIPTPFSQGIAAAANLAGGLANQIAPGQQPSAPAQVPAPQPGQIGLAPPGTAPPVQQGPVM
jgi:hypothetical protein